MLSNDFIEFETARRISVSSNMLGMKHSLRADNLVEETVTGSSYVSGRCDTVGSEEKCGGK
jgi:hypothetical protein